MSGQTNARSNAYSIVAAEYIEQIRQVCPVAAARLEQIQAQYGARAAYLAAFALANLHLHQAKTQRLPGRKDIFAYTYCAEMRDDPAALRLYEEAVAHLIAGGDWAGSLDES